MTIPLPTVFQPTGGWMNLHDTTGASSKVGGLCSAGVSVLSKGCDPRGGSVVGPASYYIIIPSVSHRRSLVRPRAKSVSPSNWLELVDVEHELHRLKLYSYASTYIYRYTFLGFSESHHRGQSPSLSLPMLLSRLSSNQRGSIADGNGAGCQLMVARDA